MPDGHDIAAPAPAKPTGNPGQDRDRHPEAAGARALAAKMLSDRDSRDWLGREIQSQYDRNPPVSPSKLRAQGRQWEANYNTGEFRAQIDSDIEPVYAMVSTADRPAVFKTTHGEPFERAAAMDRWALSYRKLLDSWDEYRPNLRLMLKERSKFGHGPVYWPHADSWQERPVPARNLLVPDGHGPDPMAWTCFMIADRITVHALVQVLDKLSRERAETYKIDNWDDAAVREAIEMVRDGDDTDGFEPSSMPQISLCEDAVDFFGGAKVKPEDEVEVVFYYLKGFDGKWAQYMFTRNGNRGYLYRDLEAYDNAGQILNTNPYDIEFKYRRIRGLGWLLKDTSYANDKLMNSITNMAMLNAAVVFQGATESSEQAMGRVRFGWSTTYVPSDLSIRNFNLDTPIEGLLLLQNRIKQVNTNIVRGKVAQPIEQENYRTARQYQGEQAAQVGLGQSLIDFFRLQQTRTHRERMRRISEAITRYELPLDRGDDTLCELEVRSPGVTILNEQLLCYEEDGWDARFVEKILPESADVSFPPTIEQLMLVRDAIFEKGGPAVDTWMNDFQRAAMGSGNALRYGGTREEDQRDRLCEANDSAKELGALLMGVPVPPKRDADHGVHGAIELEKLLELLAPYGQRNRDNGIPKHDGPPETGGEADLERKFEDWRAATAIWVHLMSDDPGAPGHLRYLEGGTRGRGEAQGLLEQAGQAIGIIQKLNAEIQQESAARQREALETTFGGTGVKDRIEMEKMSRSEARKDFIAQSDARRKDALAAHEARLEADQEHIRSRRISLSRQQAS